MTDQHKTTMTRQAWLAAYREGFRAFARSRGWTEENIESGWLDDCMPDDAWLSHGHQDPAGAAAADVRACEIEAANA